MSERLVPNNVVHLRLSIDDQVFHQIPPPTNFWDVLRTIWWSTVAFIGSVAIIGGALLATGKLDAIINRFVR